MTRQLSLWVDGRTDELLYEGQIIATRLFESTDKATIKRYPKNSKI